MPSKRVRRFGSGSVVLASGSDADRRARSTIRKQPRTLPPICVALPVGRAAIHTVQIRLICAGPRADATDWHPFCLSGRVRWPVWSGLCGMGCRCPCRWRRRSGSSWQVIASPGGDIVWGSGGLPGAVHDLTAARIWASWQT